MIQTLEADTVELNQAGIPAPLSRVLRASASQAWEDLPFLSAIPRMVELDTARRRYNLAYQNYDQQGATDWMIGQGLDGEFTFEDRSYNELELNILARRKREEIARQNVMARAEGGYGQGAVRLGVALGVSLLDPLNVASAFVPVVGEARYAQIVARAGGAFSRTTARAGVGAVEGAAGAALVEPIIFAANKQQQADYGLQDSLLNIAFGTVFGGGLHVTVGGFADIRQRRMIREFDRIVQETAGEAPAARAAPATDAVPTPKIDEVEVRVIAREVDEALAAREAALVAEAARGTGVKIDEADAAARAVQERLEPINRELMQSRQSQVAAEIERLSADPNRILFLRARHGLSDVSELIEAEAVRNVDARRAALQEQASTLRDEAAGFGGQVAEFNRARAAEVDLEQVRLARKGSLDDRIAALPKELSEHMRRRLERTVTEGVPAQQRVGQMTRDQQAAMLKATIAQGAQEQNPRLDGLETADLTRVREDARAASDPDNAPLSQPEAVRLTDEELAEAGGDELAIAERQLEKAESDLRDAQSTLDDPETMPAEIRAEMDAAKEFSDTADDYASTARLMAQCALRHAA